MISGHAHFIEAIRDKNLVRISFYSLPDAGTIDRECMPLDYGPPLGSTDGLNLYWIWDPANTAGANPLGLSPDQIVSMQVLGTNFDPNQLPLGTRPWSITRDWQSPARNNEKSGGPTNAVVH